MGQVCGRAGIGWGGRRGRVSGPPAEEGLPVRVDEAVRAGSLCHVHQYRRHSWRYLRHDAKVRKRFRTDDRRTGTRGSWVPKDPSRQGCVRVLTSTHSLHRPCTTYVPSHRSDVRCDRHFRKGLATRFPTPPVDTLRPFTDPTVRSTPYRSRLRPPVRASGVPVSGLPASLLPYVSPSSTCLCTRDVAPVVPFVAERLVFGVW